MARHVFISYRRDDSAIADELIGALSGFDFWRDTERIDGGQLWREAIARALDAAYAMILVISPRTEQSKEVYAEYFYADGQHVPVIPLLIDSCDLPFGLANRNARAWHQDKQQAVQHLRADLEKYRAKAPSLEPANDLHTYLRALQIGYLMAVGNYTPMAGEVRRRRETVSRLPQPVVMRPEFSLRRSSALFGERPVEEERREYEDLLPALHESSRVLILGEPGIGKTTTLYKFADELRLRVVEDSNAPIPLIVPLREWRDGISWEALVARHLGALAPRYRELLPKRRQLFFLLDGLNELPRDDSRAAKLTELRELIGKGARMVVTCRELDYRDETLKLDIDALTVHPMNPERVLDFLTRYLTDGRGGEDGIALAEKLFWQIAGGIELRSVWEKWRKAGAALNEFFTAEDEPKAAHTNWDETELWKQTIKLPSNLMHLAANPYLLWMFLQLYLQAGRIPPNRGELFDEFVYQLLKREGLSVGDELSAKGRELSDRLEQLAWTMQTSAVDDGVAVGGVELTLPRAYAMSIVGGEASLYRAASANLLEDAQSVRFTHQLMQEYFTARRVLREFGYGRKAHDFWPAGSWWQPSGWEEAAVLAVGMSGKDAEPLIDWLSAANPEVAAVAIQRSGIEFTDRCKLKLREAWLPQMTDLARQPEAAARTAIGRGLGSVTLANGEPLDNRPGVGLRTDGLPDVEWVDIPGGSVKLEEVKGTFKVKRFRMAKYPITNFQFQSFLNADDGYQDPKWWKNIEQISAPNRSTWLENNSPRTDVSWFEAVAFCRWLGARLGQAVRLPTEWEWQQAATAGNSKNPYPWGPDWDAIRANSYESELGRTTAVGVYPNAATKQGVFDMAGNVWEWCVNKYEKPNSRSASDIDQSNDFRVIRGGSWDDVPVGLRSSFRYRFRRRLPEQRCRLSSRPGLNLTLCSLSFYPFLRRSRRSFLRVFGVNEINC